MNRNVKIKAIRDHYMLHKAVGLMIWDDSGEKTAVAKTITFEEVDEGMYTPVDHFISDTAAQALMDSLWECGIRPTQGAGSAGSFDAQGAHLADMRKLVFDQQGQPIKPVPIRDPNSDLVGGDLFVHMRTDERYVFEKDRLGGATLTHRKEFD